MAEVKRINLALQGGGAHGAFTWGVLDRLLEDEGIEIAGISGTSAGALNGAALKAGLVHGGRETARANLDWLWTQVAGLRAPALQDWVSSLAPPTRVVSGLIENSPPFATVDALARIVSPYALGPLFRNPLERIVSRFAYDKVCADEGPRLVICATNVRTGKIRLFTGEEITAQAIMASACLPTLFQAVEIVEGDRVEAYWDGGYTGNPALFPLFEMDLPDDIVVVNINPILRDKVPETPHEIANRINEISFNSSLLREMRAIRFVQKLLDSGRLPEGSMKYVRMHMIADDALMNELNVATKTIPTAVIVTRLKAAGRAAADRFLAEHRGDLNRQETVDLEAMFG
ncbi:patatin-like phospholipase family protein [Oceaniglobus roseus]|uniref:patatin-like phospholipase family protein n=1 Tax=Oceaniglobus roseus TaxID=1737570 RepID=UPI000C7EF2F0|nr:patatin-like phospholipase family protein [Kandeliimicrobium roseum]